MRCSLALVFVAACFYGETTNDLRKSCGNGVCQGSESCSSCPADCGSCSEVPDAGTPTPDASSTGGYGPQPGITCPAGSVTISPGQDIPTIVENHAAGTTFCVLAGVYSPSRPIQPRPNQKLIGQYGAIIDGANVRMTYDIGSTSIIRGWNCSSDCSGVTVQNLVLRNLSAYNCIGVFGNSPTSVYANNWTIDHNEITGCRAGVALGNLNGATVSNNYIHHNLTTGGGGYSSFRTYNVTFHHNEIAYNAHEQKVCLTHNTVFRDNYVHNQDNGIWYDGENVGSLVEGNLVEDHSGEGIFYEVSGQGVIRNNTVRRSGSHGIFISTSHGVETYGNLVEDSFRGIQYFVACDRESGINPPYVEYEPVYLANNSTHDNVVKIPATSGALANLFTTTACTSSQLAPFLNGSRNLTFQNNHYYAPSLTGAYFIWEGLSGLVPFSTWQSLRQDTTGTIEVKP